MVEELRGEEPWLPPPRARRSAAQTNGDVKRRMMVVTQLKA